MEEAEEESEDEYEVICDMCYDVKDADMGGMHLCEGKDCLRSLMRKLRNAFRIRQAQLYT